MFPRLRKQTRDMLRDPGATEADYARMVQEIHKACGRLVTENQETTQEQTVPVYLGNGVLQMPNDDMPLRLTDPEKNVLDALVLKRACSKPELERTSGNSDAVKILKDTRKKHGLEKYISLTLTNRN